MADVGRSQISGGRPIHLVMLAGIPGSGKSTWARQFIIEHPDYYLVSTDQIRAELYGDEAIQGDWRHIWRQVVAQWQQGIEQIHRGQLAGLLYDATNARRRNRRQAIAVARELGFNYITLVWFDVPLGVALQRNQLRTRRVPTDIVARMHRQMYGAPPSMSEDVDQILRWSTDKKSEIFLGK